MKIVFLTRLFYPHTGGVEQYVLKVSEKLKARHHTVIVVAELSEKGSESYENYKGIEIYRIPNLKNNWFKKFMIWQWMWNNRKLIENADIIHCHDVFFWFLPFRFLYFRKPVFTTFHGYEGTFPPSKKAIVVRKLSEKLSKGNICTGDFIKKWYGTKPNVVSYGGVAIVKNRDKKATSQSGGKLKILLAGRLDRDIGIKNYVRALEVLEKRSVPFSFVACGDGPLRKEVKKYGKVHGFVKDLAPYMYGADFIFASSYLIILESFAAKKLVFATYDNPLKEDYLRMTPFAQWMIIERKPLALAERMFYYAKNPKEKEKIVEAAYDWVKNETWEKVTNSYIKLWNI